MTTKYPNQVDTNTEIPLSTDLVTPVKVIVTNTLRGAILATEAELGIQPSGTFATVRARLDDLDSKIAALDSGSGSGGTLEIRSNGTPIITAASILDFINGSITVPSPGIAQITLSSGGGGGDPVQETLSTSDNQTSFTLSNTPADATTIMMFVNGQKANYGTDYTVSGNIVTWNDTDFTLESSDEIEFWYLINGGGGGGTGSLSDTLAIGNTTGGTSLIFSSGDNLTLSTTSHIQSQGSLIEFDDPISISGGITTTGVLSGLTGSKLTAQASIPIAVSVGKSVLWQRSSDKKFIFTDDTSTDWVLNESIPSWANTLSISADTGSISPRITSGATLLFQQRASGIGALVGHGSLWVKNTSPTTIIFTDSVGTDFDLSSSSTSLTAPTNPGQNNLISFGLSGDLSYASSLKTDGTYLGLGSATLPTSGDLRTGSGFIWKTRTTGGVSRNLIDYGATSTDVLSIGHSSYNATLNASTLLSINVDSSVAAKFSDATASSLTSAAGGYVLALSDDKTHLQYRFVNGVVSGQSLNSVLATRNITDGYSIILSDGDSILNDDGYTIITRPSSPSQDNYFLKSIGGIGTWAPATLGGSASGDLGGSYPGPTVVDLTITGETQGSVLYFNGINWVRLSPSTDGYVLTTHSTAQNPTWSAQSGSTVNITNSAPANVTKSAAVVGVATDAARADHKHDITTATATTIGATNAEGSAVTLARSDHTHAVSDLNMASETQGDVLYFNGTNWARLPANTDGYYLQTHSSGQNPTWAPPTRNTLGVLPADVTKSPALSGSSVFAAKEDHKHNITTATATSIGATNTEGTATTLARSDHTHAVSDLNISSEVQGDVLYFNGSNWTRLAASFDGYVLTTHSTSQNPTWSDNALARDMFALTGSSNDIASSHVGKVGTVSNATTTTYTVRLNSGIAIAAKSEITLIAIGIGQLVIAAEGGVTINYSETLKARKQYSWITLKKDRNTQDLWWLTGDLELA